MDHSYGGARPKTRPLEDIRIYDTDAKPATCIFNTSSHRKEKTTKLDSVNSDVGITGQHVSTSNDFISGNVENGSTILDERNHIFPIFNSNLDLPVRKYSRHKNTMNQNGGHDTSDPRLSGIHRHDIPVINIEPIMLSNVEHLNEDHGDTCESLAAQRYQGLLHGQGNTDFVANGHTCNDTYISGDTKMKKSISNSSECSLRDKRRSYKSERQPKFPENGMEGVIKETLKERWKRSGLALRKFLSEKLGFGSYLTNKPDHSDALVMKNTGNKGPIHSNRSAVASNGNCEAGTKVKTTTNTISPNHMCSSQVSGHKNKNIKSLTLINEQSETDYDIFSLPISELANTQHVNTNKSSRICTSCAGTWISGPSFEDIPHITTSGCVTVSDTSLSDHVQTNLFRTAHLSNDSCPQSTDSASFLDSSIDCDNRLLKTCDCSSTNHGCRCSRSDCKIKSHDSRPKYCDEKCKNKLADCDSHSHNTGDEALCPCSCAATGETEQDGSRSKSRRDVRRKMSRLVKRCKLKRKQKPPVGLLDSQLATSSDEGLDGNSDKVLQNQRPSKCLKNGRHQVRSTNTAPLPSPRNEHNNCVSEGTSQVLPGLRYALPYLPERFRRSLQTSRNGQDNNHEISDTFGRAVSQDTHQNISKYRSKYYNEREAEFRARNKNIASVSSTMDDSGTRESIGEPASIQSSNHKRKHIKPDGSTNTNKNDKPKSSIARRMRLNLAKSKSKTSKDKHGECEIRITSKSANPSGANDGPAYYNLAQCMDNDIDNDAHSRSVLMSNDVHRSRSEGDGFPGSWSFGSRSRTNGEISSSIFDRNFERDHQSSMFNRNGRSSSEDLIENIDIPFMNDPFTQVRGNNSLFMGRNSFGESDLLPGGGGGGVYNRTLLDDGNRSGDEQERNEGRDSTNFFRETGSPLDDDDSGSHMSYTMLSMISDLVERMDSGLAREVDMNYNGLGTLADSLQRIPTSESTSHPSDDLQNVKCASTPSDELHNSRSGSPSDPSGEADDEFECDCEHCLLLRQHSSSDFDLAESVTDTGPTGQNDRSYAEDSELCVRTLQRKFVLFMIELDRVSSQYKGDHSSMHVQPAASLAKVPGGYGDEGLTWGYGDAALIGRNWDEGLTGGFGDDVLTRDMMELTSVDLMLMAESSLRLDIMLENVIQQMLAVQPELLSEQAAPPASKSVIDSLASVNLTIDDIEQHPCCPICLCPSELADVMSMLRCQHIFHPLCIQAWLIKSGTCPVCRSSI